VIDIILDIIALMVALVILLTSIGMLVMVFKDTVDMLKGDENK